MKSIFRFFRQLKKNVSPRIHGLSPRNAKLFFAFLGIFILGIIGSLNFISTQFSVPVPARGGTLHEGILGTPRFINPVLATSDIDQDLTRLTYSGLVRTMATADNTDVETVPDLAESYTVSPDGKTYTFILRDNAVFHDGKSVTADDVVFTIETIQDPRFQSPEFINWQGITASAIDTKTVQITLSRPFSGFLDTASLGILPKHIWGSLTVDEFLANNRNNLPIGSGPYKVTNIDRDKNGLPKSYTFSSFNRFTLGRPYINTLLISLYPNEQSLLNAYQRGDFSLLANIRPYEITKENTKFTITTPLPRMFGLFLNPEKNEIFKDASLRNIMRDAVDQNDIIATVFQSHAQPINHPLPNLDQSDRTPAETAALEKRLDTLGWVINPETGIRSKGGKNLSFTISTADTAELKYTAQVIQKQLRTLGVATELQIFQLGDLENSVIKPRNFESLLFGQFIRNDADLYAFWHSSQSSDPGLNITKYTSKNLDTALEQLFGTFDPVTRTELFKKIANEISGAPVIWLYQPNFIYALHRPVYGMHLHALISKDDRFANIHQWYVETDTVWKFFQK